MTEITCPFCGDDEFDLYGFQLHLERGYCEKYRTIQDPAKVKTAPAIAVCICNTTHFDRETTGRCPVHYPPEP